MLGRVILADIFPIQISFAINDVFSLFELNSRSTAVLNQQSLHFSPLENCKNGDRIGGKMVVRKR